MSFADGRVFGPRGKLNTQNPRHPHAGSCPVWPPSSQHKAVQVRRAGAPEAALRPPSANLAGPWNASPTPTTSLSQFQVSVSREKRLGCASFPVSLSPSLPPSFPPSLSSQVISPSEALSVQPGNYTGCRAILGLPILSREWDLKPRECQRLEEVFLLHCLEPDLFPQSWSS